MLISKLISRAFHLFIYLFFPLPPQTPLLWNLDIPDSKYAATRIFSKPAIRMFKVCRLTD